MHSVEMQNRADLMNTISRFHLISRYVTGKVNFSQGIIFCDTRRILAYFLIHIYKFNKLTVYFTLNIYHFQI